jgi:hypothetical protein
MIGRRVCADPVGSNAPTSYGNNDPLSMMLLRPFASGRDAWPVARRLGRRRRRPHSIQGISIMKRLACSMLLLAILTGSAEARDMVREVAGVEQAPAGQPYDYIVHVRNIPAIGYTPQVKADRDRMALRSLRRQCRSGRIVGDDKIDTEILGITSSYPDYIVLVNCRKF